jgi:hypothetical protein
MTARVLAVTLLRVYGVTLLARSISPIVSFFGSLPMLLSTENSVSRLAVGTSLAGVFVQLLVGLLVLLSSDSVSGRICAGLPQPESERSAGPELFPLGVALIGLYYLLSGLYGVTYALAQWRLVASAKASDIRPAAFLDTGTLASSILLTLLGSWLFVSPAGVVQLAEWLRHSLSRRNDSSRNVEA